jgi:hypothetical protein
MRRTRNPAKPIRNPAATSIPDGFGPCERIGNSPSSNRAIPANMASRPSKAVIVLESERIRTVSNDQAEGHRANGGRLEQMRSLGVPSSRWFGTVFVIINIEARLDASLSEIPHHVWRHNESFVSGRHGQADEQVNGKSVG